MLARGQELQLSPKLVETVLPEAAHAMAAMERVVGDAALASDEAAHAMLDYLQEQVAGSGVPATCLYGANNKLTRESPPFNPDETCLPNRPFRATVARAVGVENLAGVKRNRR